MMFSGQYLIEIDDEVTRLGGLIEDLFLLSRIDTDRLKVGNEMVRYSTISVSRSICYSTTHRPKNHSNLH